MNNPGKAVCLIRFGNTRALSGVLSNKPNRGFLNASKLIRTPVEVFGYRKMSKPYLSYEEVKEFTGRVKIESIESYLIGERIPYARGHGVITVPRKAYEEYCIRKLDLEYESSDNKGLTVSKMS